MSDRGAVLILQIRDGCDKAWSGISGEVPSTDSLTTALREGNLGVAGPVESANVKDAVQWATYELHTRLLAELIAGDFQRGEAYGLGRALAETALFPSIQDCNSFVEEFKPYRIYQIVIWLADLHRSFPEHAADAVEQTLLTWSQPNWIEDSLTFGDQKLHWQQDGPKIQRCLRRQGQIWLALLSGQKNPTDLLRLRDYVVAAKEMLSSIAALAWSFLFQTGIGRLLTCIVLVLTIAMAIAVYFGGGLVGGATAPIIGFLATVGVTATSVIAAVNKSMSLVGSALWQAQLRNSVATAALVSPVAAAGTSLQTDAALNDRQTDPDEQDPSILGSEPSNSRSPPSRPGPVARA